MAQPLKSWPKGSIACCVCRSDDPYRNPVPGSKEIDCWQCGAKCLIGPATLDRIAALPHVTILCLNCARAYYDASGVNMEVLPDSAQQAKERGQPFGRTHVIDEGE